MYQQGVINCQKTLNDKDNCQVCDDDDDDDVGSLGQRGIIIMLMMMVTMMVMLMMISCPQTSPTLSIQVWDWNSHSYHQYRLHHNPVSPFVEQS